MKTLLQQVPVTASRCCTSMQRLLAATHGLVTACSVAGLLRGFRRTRQACLASRTEANGAKLFSTCAPRRTCALATADVTPVRVALCDARQESASRWAAWLLRADSCRTCPSCAMNRAAIARTIALALCTLLLGARWCSGRNALHSKQQGFLLLPRILSSVCGPLRTRRRLHRRALRCRLLQSLHPRQ